MDIKKTAQKLVGEIKSFFIKVDPLKEKIEDAMADAIEKAEANTTLQEGEKALLQAGLKAGVTFLQSQAGTSVPLTDEQYAQIAQGIMDAKTKLMPKLIAQLRKK